MDKLDQIKQPVKKEFIEFNNLYDSSLASANPLLNEVLSYIKKRNGKMMRPLLTLLVAKLFGDINFATYHSALSLELLHTASLVHDDVVDESDKRRGQLSVNATYNNKLAVLVGDYMLATSLRHSYLTSNFGIVELISSLGQYLSEGEIIQLTSVNNSIFSEDIYFDIIKKKTAALFSASSKAGAISVSADEKSISQMSKMGEVLGIAFQIKDDIFDYYRTVNIGKPTGNDMQEGKLTLPSLYVLNNCDNNEMKEVALRIKSKSATENEILSFIEFVQNNGGIDYAMGVMKKYCDKAYSLIPTNADPDVIQSLHDYVSYVIDRKK